MDVRRFVIAAMVTVVGCHHRDLTEGRYQGMVELDQTDVGFEISGRIATLDIAAGSLVHRGDKLASLDDVIDRQTREVRAREVDTAKAELALLLAGTRVEDVRAAQAQVAAARATEEVVSRALDRDRKLTTEGAVTGAQLDEESGQYARALADRRVAEQRLRALAKGARPEELARADAQVATAQQTLELADRVLGKHVVRSPLEGVVVDVYPKLGEVVATGTPITSIVDRARPYADVFVPVADLPRIHLGDPIALVVEGDPREVPGIVERVFPHLEFSPRFIYSPRERPNLLARVRVRLDDREGRLYTGQPAYVRLGPPRVLVSL